ncbi:uncharacterized protein TNCT_49421 [Trichonephila clavata]|uniref:Retrovirus-related Pol polyprotein from transposon TNT 1-94-like beta-barrel domain-containing protein n=1 Tax=Trichonephila clavata TaxID=2740835 RepID=A0A8X6GIE6_TRICU|nr:uncharacterized protein TNCT_49421 [Trichonephila clavata]
MKIGLFDKIKELIAEESRVKQSTKDQHEACAFQIGERNLKLRRKKSHPPPNKNVGTIRDDVKSTKYSRSSYITETNLNQHYGKDTWIYDTAATSHFCCQKNFLQNFQPVNNMRMTIAVGGVTCEIIGTRTVSMIFQNEGDSEIVGFRNVLYSPKSQINLISGSLIDKAGSNFICKKGQINLHGKYGHKVFTVKNVNGLYCVKPKIDASHIYKNVKERRNLNL